MPDNILAQPIAVPPAAATTPDSIYAALTESRQRWQHLVALVADFAFETNADGRFTFVTPDPALGWPSASLIGQSCDLLIGNERGGAVLNPFRPITAVKRHRSWVRRFGGELAMLSFSAIPLHDAKGDIIGSRGIAVDITDKEATSAQIVGRLRRGEVLEHILGQVEQETDTDAMMDAALWALSHALGAEGAAVLGSMTEDGAIELLHESGPGGPEVRAVAARLIGQDSTEASHTACDDGRIILAVRCQTRFSKRAGLAVWRKSSGRAWDMEDMLLARSAVRIVRMILDYAAFAREQAHQARIDSLTGLLNRRAFLEEARRNISRLDREAASGSLLFADLDGFKAINDRLGHAVGDQVLSQFSDMLRKQVRSSDLVARLGGDEFAVWLGGTDHMTAAERADALCKSVGPQIEAALDKPLPGLGVSIGIATRHAGSHEAIEDLIRRADMAMYEVKRSGRSHWRVATRDDA